ncbi:MAG: hypothetical protein QXQ53_09175 [Candidatus Methanosuratincola sp.]
MRQENTTSRSSAQSVGTPDVDELAAGIAAVKILLDHLLDDRPGKTVLPLEPALILGQEPVEMMEEYPIKDSPLRMPVTIDSRHGRRKASRTEPMSGIGPRLPGKRR